MALVPVEIVNNSTNPLTGKPNVVRMQVDDGEQLAYFRKLVRADQLVSVEVLKPAPAPARKPATAK